MYPLQWQLSTHWSLGEEDYSRLVLVTRECRESQLVAVKKDPSRLVLVTRECKGCRVVAVKRSPGRRSMFLLNFSPPFSSQIQLRMVGGAHLQELTVFGEWTQQKQNEHVSTLKMRAIPKVVIAS